MSTALNQLRVIICSATFSYCRPFGRFHETCSCYDNNSFPRPPLHHDIDRLELEPRKNAQEALEPPCDEGATMAVTAKGVLANEMVVTRL